MFLGLGFTDTEAIIITMTENEYCHFLGIAALYEATLTWFPSRNSPSPIRIKLLLGLCHCIAIFDGIFPTASHAVFRGGKSGFRWRWRPVPRLSGLQVHKSRRYTPPSPPTPLHPPPECLNQEPIQPSTPPHPPPLPSPYPNQLRLLAHIIGN